MGIGMNKALLLLGAVLLCGVLLFGCTGGSGQPAGGGASATPTAQATQGGGATATPTQGGAGGGGNGGGGGNDLLGKGSPT